MKVKMMRMRMMRRAAPVLPSLVMDVVVGFVHGDACALIGLCPHLGLEYLGLVEEGVVEREYELAHFVELLDGVGGHCLLRAVLCALYVVRCVWFACFGPDSGAGTGVACVLRQPPFCKVAARPQKRTGAQQRGRVGTTRQSKKKKKNRRKV